MAHSESRDVYAFIVAWWMACYVGYIANIEIKTALIAYPIYVIVLSVSFLTGHNWFYHDAPNSVNLFFIFIVLFNGILFISPMIVNKLVRTMMNKFFWKNETH